MQRTAYLEKISPWGKLLLLISMIILAALVTSLAGLLIGKLYFDVDLITLSGYITNPETDEQVIFIKIYQLINQIGVFFIPVILFAFLVNPSVSGYFNLNKRPNTTNMLIMGVVVFTILPFVNYLGDLNQSMVFPESLAWLEEWMKEKEEQAMLLTEAFLQTNTIAGLVVNLFIVALVPAIGEELLFRGALLKLFTNISRNIHVAVFFTAFLFAAIHFQFYGFLPRFFIGLILGYSFVITGNLWVPIFVHFVNNSASVIVYYLHYNGYINVPMEDFGTADSPVYIIGSLLISIWLMVIVGRRKGLWFNNLKP